LTSHAGSLSSSGSEFQTVGPATGKAQRPYVLSRQRGTMSRCRSAECSQCRDATSMAEVTWSASYRGACPCKLIQRMSPAVMNKCLYYNKRFIHAKRKKWDPDCIKESLHDTNSQNKHLHTAPPSPRVASNMAGQLLVAADVTTKNILLMSRKTKKCPMHKRPWRDTCKPTDHSSLLWIFQRIGSVAKWHFKMPNKPNTEF